MNDQEQIECATKEMQLRHSESWYAENCPTRFQTGQLDAGCQSAVLQIVSQLQQFETYVKLETGISAHDIAKIIQALTLDYPELLYFELVAFGLEDKRVWRLRFAQKSKEEFLQIYDRIIAWIYAHSAQASDMTLWERVRHFYTLLAAFYTSSDSRADFNSLQCVLHRKATALGVACVFQHLCNRGGIPCATMRAVVNGKYQHYFNVVRVENKWYNVDCGLAQQARKDELTYAYLGFPDTAIGSNVVLSGAKLPCSHWAPHYLTHITSETTYQDVARCITDGVAAGQKGVDLLNIAGLSVQRLKCLAVGGLCYSKLYGDNQLNLEAVELLKYTGVPVFRLVLSKNAMKSMAFPRIIQPSDEVTLTYELARFVARGLGCNVRQFAFFTADALYWFSEMQESEIVGGEWILSRIPSIIRTMREYFLVEDAFGGFKYICNDESRMILIQL